LSGGLDSSLISAIAAYCEQGKKLHSFSIGMQISRCCRKVADFAMNTVDLFSVEEGIKIVDKLFGI
jgi:asparagine synthetase B (glutamine-hydrolysing)